MRLTAKQREEIVDKLKMLDGLPPHHGFNICRGDSYFARSIVDQYGMSIEDLKRTVGFAKIRRRVNALLKVAAGVKS